MKIEEGPNHSALAIRAENRRRCANSGERRAGSGPIGALTVRHCAKVGTTGLSRRFLLGRDAARAGLDFLQCHRGLTKNQNQTARPPAFFTTFETTYPRKTQ